MAKGKKIQRLYNYDVEDIWLMRQVLIDWSYELRSRGYVWPMKRCKRINEWFNYLNI